MSRVNASFFFCLSLFFGSLATADTDQKNRAGADATRAGYQYDRECQQQRAQFPTLSTHDAAKEIYKNAFTLSFDGDMQKAQIASSCASFLHSGDEHWSIEAKDLLSF